MSNIYTLPINNFRLQLHTAIAKCKKSQAQQPGSSFSTPFRTVVLLSLSLFVLGSCNEKVVISDLDENKVDLETLSKNKALGHVYNVQAALAQSPERIEKLSNKTMQLVLAKPDSVRVEGRSQVWHYVGAQCVLDVYWTQKSNKVMVQDYYEFRARRDLFQKASINDNATLQDWQCMQSLIQDRRQRVEAGFDDLYAVLSLNAHKS